MQHIWQPWQIWGAKILSHIRQDISKYSKFHIYISIRTRDCSSSFVKNCTWRLASEFRKDERRVLVSTWAQLTEETRKQPPLSNFLVLDQVPAHQEATQYGFGKRSYALRVVLAPCWLGPFCQPRPRGSLWSHCHRRVMVPACAYTAVRNWTQSSVSVIAFQQVMSHSAC